MQCQPQERLSCELPSLLPSLGSDPTFVERRDCEVDVCGPPECSPPGSLKGRTMREADREL